MENEPEETSPPQATRSPLRRVGFKLALALAVVAAAALLAYPRTPIPHFPEATLCVSSVDGHEFGWVGLQDPQSPHGFIPGALTLSVKPKSWKYVDKKKGNSLKVDWRLLRSSTTADSYEFRITAGSNAVPMVKHVDVSHDPVELFRADDVVVSIKEKSLREGDSTVMKGI